jgi:nitrate reductase alpha subunit
MTDISRRGFIKVAGGAGLATLIGLLDLELLGLEAFPGIENPLLTYPNRGWEEIYRDQYGYDQSFTVICAPNDTHMCRLRAFARNGVVMRLEQNYDGANYGDPQGNTSTAHWNPRGCLKGYTLHRRVYGPYRLRSPMLRRGWKRWADDGFPSLSDEDHERRTQEESRWWWWCGCGCGWEGEYGAGFARRDGS